MNEILNFLFQQYGSYSQVDIGLEIFAVFFGFLSVWFSKNNNVLVFPTGLINTSIFVYLLFKWELLGDMIINAYYFVVSIYGWYYWTRKNSNNDYTPISKVNYNDQKIILVISILSAIFVSLMYTVFNKWSGLVSYIDILTTSIFFSAMWLMARRKIESWIFWIIGDLISIPLYFYKGLTVTSIQYLIFTIIAIFGYRTWKKILNRSLQIS